MDMSSSLGFLRMLLFTPLSSLSMLKLENWIMHSKFYDEMHVKDEVSWNCIISGYVRVKLFEEAIDLFNEMRRAGIRPDESTLVTVLSACAQSGHLTTGERIKTWIVERNLSSNIRLVNALIGMYSKCNELDKASSLFDNMINNNIVTWNVMIGGYTHTHRYKESLELFRTMLQSNYEVNEVTFLSVLPACAHMDALDTGKWIHVILYSHDLNLNLLNLQKLKICFFCNNLSIFCNLMGQ
ncbi:putative tetratricopeptide-like helical domain superfamily [Helianthus debilis subsp. tardiflorus]